VGLGERIKILRSQADIERDGLAKAIGITYHALSKYETNEREPDYQTIRKIAEYFGVSTDYLLGINESEHDNGYPNFSMAFADLMKRAQGSNRSINEYALDAGVSATYISRLQRGLVSKPPGVDVIRKLSARADNGVTYRDLMDAAGYLVVEPADFSLAHIPILGTIRAGLPILAEENIEGYLDIPDNMQADYVLRVVGDSMIGSGIIDGDLAICRENQMANSGQIVVAIKDLANGYSEATLKYYFENGKGRTLRPANPNYEEIDMVSDGYRIAGTLVASVRQDAPGYQVYKDYLTVCGREEWTEVIEKAAQGGFKPEQVRDLLEMQIEIAKKMRGLK